MCLCWDAALSGAVLPYVIPWAAAIQRAQKVVQKERMFPWVVFWSPWDRDEIADIFSKCFQNLTSY